MNFKAGARICLPKHSPSILTTQFIAMKSLIDSTLTESKAHDLFLDAYNYAKQKNDPELINFQTGLLLAEIEENQRILSESMDQLLNKLN